VVLKLNTGQLYLEPTTYKITLDIQIEKYGLPGKLF